MESWILGHQAAVRLSAFLVVFALMAGLEAAAPRRPLRASRTRRWTVNLGMIALNSALVRALLPFGAAGAALFAEARGFGFLNAVRLPEAVEAAFAIVLLDLAIYVQHVAFHRAPLLWRLHKVHHIDLDLDVTTGGRFHPLEILLSALYKMAAAVAIGASPLAVVLFEILLNATALFNHGNIRLAGGLDRALRILVVTPDMHRVHHSALPAETDSNYGFNLPWWDRLFGTYKAAPEAGHLGMTIGLPAYRAERWLRLPWLLAAPFLATPKDAPGP
jgi:sterol desaturase/sphingolipid hydroxylase (fatty acid hydroxylase superfamily)